VDDTQIQIQFSDLTQALQALGTVIADTNAQMLVMQTKFRQFDRDLTHVSVKVDSVQTKLHQLHLESNNKISVVTAMALGLETELELRIFNKMFVPWIATSEGKYNSDVLVKMAYDAKMQAKELE